MVEFLGILVKNLVITVVDLGYVTVHLLIALSVFNVNSEFSNICLQMRQRERSI